jgi:predicted Fe-S protein YdhL (DUF1289 family)
MALIDNPADVPSPCIGICQLDEARRICIGCRRTPMEIAEWSGASSDRKRAILARLRQQPSGSAAPQYRREAGG